MATRKSTTERFLAKVAIGEPHECWDWQGGIKPNGYGICTSIINSYLPPWGAHRASYALFVGPIPDGFEVDHLCRNRRCVNPAHLEAVTPEENKRRAIVPKGTHCRNGHLYEDGSTYTYVVRGRPRPRICKACHLAGTARYRAKLKAKRIAQREAA